MKIVNSNQMFIRKDLVIILKKMLGPYQMLSSFQKFGQSCNGTLLNRVFMSTHLTSLVHCMAHLSRITCSENPLLRPTLLHHIGMIIIRPKDQHFVSMRTEKPGGIYENCSQKWQLF
jgi:hypothetical protein